MVLTIAWLSMLQINTYYLLLFLSAYKYVRLWALLGARRAPALWAALCKWTALFSFSNIVYYLGNFAFSKSLAKPGPPTAQDHAQRWRLAGAQAGPKTLGDAEQAFKHIVQASNFHFSLIIALLVVFAFFFVFLMKNEDFWFFFIFFASLCSWGSQEAPGGHKEPREAQGEPPSYEFLRFPTLSYGFLRFPTVSYAFLRFPTVSYAFLRFPTLSYALLGGLPRPPRPPKLPGACSPPCPAKNHNFDQNLQNWMKKFKVTAKNF